MNKLAGKNQKWGRCRVPRHKDCEVLAEIRHPIARRTARLAHLQQELATMLGQCPACGRLSSTVESRRRNTSYVDDSMNFITTCVDCFVEEEIYWAEMWADYWGGRL